MNHIECSHRVLNTVYFFVEDDADMRLTPLGYEIGLATRERYDAMQSKRAQRDALIAFCESYLVKGTEEMNAFLVENGTTPLSASVRLVDLVKRPQLSITALACSLSRLAKEIGRIEEERREEIVESAEILIKYGGYILRERELAEKQSRLEYVDSGVDGLRGSDRVVYRGETEAGEAGVRQQSDRLRGYRGFRRQI